MWSPMTSIYLSDYMSFPKISQSLNFVRLDVEIEELLENLPGAPAAMPPRYL